MIRHYGLQIGDIVRFDGELLLVCSFSNFDNNRAILRRPDCVTFEQTEIGLVHTCPTVWAVAEWCEIIVPREFRV